MNLSTGAAVPPRVAASELIGDDADFDNIEEEDDEEEKGKSSIFTEDKLEELFSNLKITN